MHLRFLYSLFTAVTLVPLVLGGPPLTMSTSGSCGSGVTCLGSRFGDCCSSQSFCGSGPTYCGGGCQSEFGACSSNDTNVSPSNDGSCGAKSPHQYICTGSVLGNCCSVSGFCGSDDTYCGTGCQSAFGSCGIGNGNSSTSSSSASSSASAQTTGASSTTASNTSTSGLSPGAKAGIGVGVSLSALLLVGAIAYLLMRRYRRHAVSTDSPPHSQHPPTTMSDVPSYGGMVEKFPYDTKLYREPDETGMSVMSSHGTGTSETGLSEMAGDSLGVGSRMRSELPAYTKHMELPARDPSPRAQLARLNERVLAGYDGAYRGS